MDAVDADTARALAEAVIQEWRVRDADLYDLSIDAVEEHSRAWIVTYTTERFKASGDVRYQLAGTVHWSWRRLLGGCTSTGVGPTSTRCSCSGSTTENVRNCRDRARHAPSPRALVKPSDTATFPSCQSNRRAAGGTPYRPSKIRTPMSIEH